MDTPSYIEGLRFELAYGISELDDPEEAMISVMEGNPAEEHTLLTLDFAPVCGNVYGLALTKDEGGAWVLLPYAAEEETAPSFGGSSVRAGDESTLRVEDGEDGTLNVNVEIARLCVLENGKGSSDRGMLLFEATDLNENPILCRLSFAADGSLTLRIVESMWEYLPEGTLPFFRLQRYYNRV